MKQIFIIFFLFISMANVYAESRDDFVNKIIEKTYVDKDGKEITKDMMDANVKKLKEAVSSSHIFTKSLHLRTCESKVATLSMFSSLFSLINPVAFLVGVILIIVMLKKFFIDNAQQAANGRSTNITMGFWYLFFAMIFLQFNSFINWYDVNIISNFSSKCNSTEGNASIMEMFMVLAYGMLFLMTDFFGILIIVLGLFELTKKEKNEKQSTIIKTASMILFGVFLLNIKGFLVFIGADIS